MFAFVTTPALLRNVATTSTSFFGQAAGAVTTVRRGTAAAAVKKRTTTRAQLIGIPDDLRGKNVEPSAHEVLLAELRYSDPSRLPALIEASLGQLDEEFYTFLERTINESADLEERETLRALRDAITSIMGQMLEQIQKQQVEQQQQQAAGESATSGGEEKKDSAQASYDELIDLFVKSMQSADDGDDEAQRAEAVKNTVDLHYHRIDLQFLERLSERIVSGGARAAELARVRDAITGVMNARVGVAMGALKGVLAARSGANGGLEGMESALVELGRSGGVDDAFVLLLQANVDEARKAGATDAVAVLEKLLAKAVELKDLSVAPEVRLIRTLLRTDDQEERATLLMDAFEAGGSVMLPDDGSKRQTMSMGTKVDGKKFVQALRTLIEQYGHVDQTFVLRLSNMGEEAEQIARKIYDMEGKDVQALQDEAFHKRSVSIWDLEEFEHQEIGEGREAPWEGKLGPIPEKMGFGSDGKLSI